MRRIIGGALVLLVGILACNNAGANLTLPPLGLGAIGINTYLDRNGTHAPDPGDTTYAGIRIALLLPGGTDTLRIATTNVQGLAEFDSVPIGTYRIAVDRHALGDSIGVVVGDTGTIRLAADSLTSVQTIRLGFTESSIAASRTLPLGKRVLLRGIVVSPLQFFHDSSTFLVDTSGSIRVTSSTGHNGGNNIGDSIVVLGTTGTVLGQRVLLKGQVTTVGVSTAPLPQLVSVADAHNARNGVLDAVLVQLSNVVISDTIPATPEFVVVVADPVDTTIKTRVRFDQLINTPHGLFPPGRTGTFRGVLVPVGDGTWELKPRGGGDVVLN